jgi:hypothetical protein
MTYRLYSDAGHAWLRVAREELHELDIAEEVSGYSYEYGDWVYLEEDCDMRKFLQAKGVMKAGQWLDENVTVHESKRSRVRGYPFYKVRKGETV